MFFSNVIFKYFSVEDCKHSLPSLCNTLYNNRYWIYFPITLFLKIKFKIKHVPVDNVLDV